LKGGYLNMANPRLIADAMVDVVCNRRSSADLFFYNIGKTVEGFSTDVAYLVTDFFDTDNRYRNETEKLRMMNRIKKGVSRNTLEAIFNIVFKKFMASLNVDDLKKIAISVGGVATAKVFVNSLFINDLSAALAMRVVSRLFVSLGVSSFVIVGGSMAKAVYKSEDLQKEHPWLYNELKSKGDLDLFYFIVEGYVEPFVTAIEVKRIDQITWSKINQLFVDGVSRCSRR